MAYPFKSDGSLFIRPQVHSTFFRLSKFIAALGKRTEKPAQSIPEQHRRIIFESLESRVLLSADPAAVQFDMSNSHNELLLRIETVVDGNQVSSDRVQLVDIASQALVFDQDATEIASFTIVGTAAEDRLQVDGSIFAAELGVSFQGGAGTDVLQGADQINLLWEIAGEDRGSVGSVVFNEVEHLTGGINNEDTFRLLQGGAVSAGLDGGAGGFDTLELVGNYTAVESIAINPNAGVIIADGTRLEYDGLEPIPMTGTIANLIISGSAADDTMVISAGPVVGQLMATMVGTGETLIFNSPTASLTINALAGNDTVTFVSFDPTFAAALIVNGDGGTDAIIVAPTVNLNTGAGAVTFNAENILLNPGASVVTTGAVNFNAIDTQGSVVTPSTNNLPILNAIINITGATVAGSNINLLAQTQLVSNITNLLGSPIAPLGVVNNTLINVDNNSQLTATGQITANAQSIFDVTVTASAVNIGGVGELAIASPNIVGITTANIAGNTLINAGGNVVISATVTDNPATGNGIASLANGLTGASLVGSTTAAPVINLTTAATLGGAAQIANVIGGWSWCWRASSYPVAMSNTLQYLLMRGGWL